MLFDTLKSGIEGESDNLLSINFVLNGNAEKLHYKKLTGAEYDKIRAKSKTIKLSKQDDGRELETHYIDEDKLRVNIILEKTCDKEGVKVFSITNPDHKRLVSKMSFENQAYIAYQMGFKSLPDLIAEQEDLLKKMNG